MTGLAAIAVVIPAHNEEAPLSAALASVRRATRHPAVRSVRQLVVVAADACTDRTIQVAVREGAVVAALDARSPGEARAAGARLALDTLGVDPAAVWIASTDADSEVPSRWLAHQRVCADRGWDAVVGTIRPQGWPPVLEGVMSDHVRAYATAGSTEHPSSLHPHVHGANLGVRADAYLSVGGFPPAPPERITHWWPPCRRIVIVFCAPGVFPFSPPRVWLPELGAVMQITLLNS